MEIMSKTTFSISYDGPALQSGSMDVRDLAPALLAVGQLFEAVNEEINGDKTKVKVNVVATNRGSFEIVLDLSQGILQQAVSLLNTDETTAAINLLKLITLTGSGYGLIKFFKWIKGRNPTKIESLKKKRTRIVIDDEVIEIPNEIWKLYQNPIIRQAIEKIISTPLKTDGVESFEITDNKTKERIEKSESVFFEYKALDEKVLHENTFEKSFSIVSLSFNPANKWRLNDGENTYSVSINDMEFLEEVEKKQKQFAKNDILVCEIRTIQTMEDSRLKTTYSVEKVKEHRHSPERVSLLPE